jgi:hypothetical protein
VRDDKGQYESPLSPDVVHDQTPGETRRSLGHLCGLSQ